MEDGDKMDKGKDQYMESLLYVNFESFPKMGTKMAVEATLF
jgi:hypothetical protein